jgi:hypothetical protein
MTQPIRGNDRANSSYYDPSEQVSRARGASDGAGGASGASGSGGAEGAGNGAGNTNKAPRSDGPGLPCFFEAQSAARDCGAALLTKNFYAAVFCGESLAALAECVTNASEK